MSINWERGTHPDLVEEEQQAAQEAPQQAPPASRGRGRGRAPVAVEAPPVQPDAPPAARDGAEGSADESQAPTEPPAWLAEAREAFEKDPETAFRTLAKNLPRESLEKDETLSGLIGHKADQLARDRARQAEKDAVERQKLEAAQNNDLYTLGELSQRELQERLVAQQTAQAAGPFMDGVVLFQRSLPEPLQEKVQGRTFGEGKGQAAGVAEYLQFLHDEGVKLAVDREVQRRESALRKSVLSEVNGDEPVPERESGTPGRVREVTDEQIAAMSMQQYDALFDENGHPRPGVRHRSTRGIPLRQH